VGGADAAGVAGADVADEGAAAVEARGFRREERRVAQATSHAHTLWLWRNR